MFCNCVQVSEGIIDLTTFIAIKSSPTHYFPQNHTSAIIEFGQRLSQKVNMRQSSLIFTVLSNENFDEKMMIIINNIIIYYLLGAN